MDNPKQRLIEAYKNPYNFEPDWQPTHEGQSSNLSCGDDVTIVLKVEKEVIMKAGFRGEGCSIALGMASLLCKHFEGKPFKQIHNWSQEDHLRLTEIELKETRQKCALLCYEALLIAFHATKRD